MRTLAVWWVVITGITGAGSAMSMGKRLDGIFRYHVLETLKQEKLFEFLKTPRTYGQILAEFQYVDSPYLRELLNVLSADKQRVLIADDSHYHVHRDFALPGLDKVMGQTDKKLHNFHFMAKGITQYIPARLRNEPMELSDSFEQDGRQLLVKFDRTLGQRVYMTVRKAAFAALPREDFQWLHGKSLIDVGCGSGRETAELWHHLGGNVKITAIDPVASMVEMGDKNFVVLLDEIDLAHPPVTDDNRPAFKEASATRLPFPDNTFDAAFHSLVLHWTADPKKAINEIVRVVKPGGLIFGTQATKPHLNPYFDMVIKVNVNCYGFFWREEFVRWYGEHGVEIKIATPVGAFYGRKPLQPPVHSTR